MIMFGQLNSFSLPNTTAPTPETPSIFTKKKKTPFPYMWVRMCKVSLTASAQHMQTSRNPSGRGSESVFRSPQSVVRSPKSVGHIVDAVRPTFRSVFVGSGLPLLLPIFFEVFRTRAELCGCLLEQRGSINVYCLQMHSKNHLHYLFRIIRAWST